MDLTSKFYVLLPDSVDLMLVDSLCFLLLLEKKPIGDGLFNNK